MSLHRTLVTRLRFAALFGGVLLVSCSPAGNVETTTIDGVGPLPLPTRDQATVQLGDPAPFDMACLSRSGPSTAISGFRPNLHFDMEVSSDSSMLSTRHAHSGNSSYRIPSGQEYTPAIERTLGDMPEPLTTIVVGIWIHSDTTIGKFTMVADARRGEEQLAWMGKDLDQTGAGMGQWMRFQGEFDLRGLGLSQNDKVRIYFWNADKREVFLDDMDVVFRSEGVLGKPGGTPFDTENKGSGVAPPPFAKFTPIDPVMAQDHGIVPGLVAPAASSDTHPLTPGNPLRLRFVDGDAVGRVIGDNGRTEFLVRAWCPEFGKDLFGFERVMIAPCAKGLRIIGFDIDIDPGTGNVLVAKEPAPMGAECSITPPGP